MWARGSRNALGNINTIHIVRLVVFSVRFANMVWMKHTAVQGQVVSPSFKQGLKG